LETVWKSTSASGAPDNSSLSHFSAMTWPSWLGRAVRNWHRHAIEQASRRWRGGRCDDSARTRRKILISTQVGELTGRPLLGAEVLAGYLVFGTVSGTVRKSTSASGAPDNSSLSRFSATTRPSWLGQAVRNSHRHAVEQASRRWRGGRRDDSARTRRKF
jgi:hypothetical protein